MRQATRVRQCECAHTLVRTSCHMPDCPQRRWCRSSTRRPRAQERPPASPTFPRSPALPSARLPHPPRGRLAQAWLTSAGRAHVHRPRAPASRKHWRRRFLWIESLSYDRRPRRLLRHTWAPPNGRCPAAPVRVCCISHTHGHSTARRVLWQLGPMGSGQRGSVRSFGCMLCAVASQPTRAPHTDASFRANTQMRDCGAGGAVRGVAHAKKAEVERRTRQACDPTCTG